MEEAEKHYKKYQKMWEDKQNELFLKEHQVR